jgi:hypothetical protein
VIDRRGLGGQVSWLDVLGAVAERLLDVDAQALGGPLGEHAVDCGSGACGRSPP